jgi:hypothetical protein
MHLLVFAIANELDFIPGRELGLNQGLRVVARADSELRDTLVDLRFENTILDSMVGTNKSTRTLNSDIMLVAQDVYSALANSEQRHVPLLVHLIVFADLLQLRNVAWLNDTPQQGLI